MSTAPRDTLAAPQLGRFQNTFRALRVRNYRLWWIGQLVSLCGSWMQRVAQAWLVLQITDSPLALGTVTMLQFAPVTLLALFGGVVADRFPKQRLLALTQAVQMLQAVALAVLLGLANAFDVPTRQAMLSELVSPDDLPNAVALNSSLFNTARVVGPSVAGAIIATAGITACFWLNAASYLAVIAALLAMRPAEMLGSGRPARGRFISQLGEGLSYALRTREVCLIVILLASIGTFGFNFNIFVPLLARYVLETGAVGFGVLFSFLGAGAVTSSLMVASRRDATERAVYFGAAGFTVLLFLVALSPWFAVTAGLMALLGATSTLFSATSNSRLQLLAPPELRGRVMSIYSLLFMGTTPIGSFTIGALSEHLGVQTALAICAGLCALGVLAATIYARRTAALSPLPVGEG